MTLDIKTKKRALLHVQSACDKASVCVCVYIYIYKSRDLMWESMRFCHMALSMKRNKILLSHIRDKNKFKNIDSLFLLVQYFKTTFVTFFHPMF